MYIYIYLYGDLICPPNVQTLLRLPRAARALAENIKILDSTVYEISYRDAQRGMKQCHRFVLGYMWLALSSFLEGRKLYKLRPKLLASYRYTETHVYCP